MRALQKIVKNGNSTQVTIPRPILIHLGWLPGEAVVLELLEDNRLLVSRAAVVIEAAPQHGLVRLDTQPGGAR